MAPAHYFAHSSGTADQTTWHLLSEHLAETGRRAAESLAVLGCTELAQAAGLLHDLGKYSREFQGRLHGDYSRVDHSTAGAKIAQERYGLSLGKLLAFCIAGHHTGLANGVRGESARARALRDRLEQEFGSGLPVLDDSWQKEVALPPVIQPPLLKPKDPEDVGFSIAFFTRMLFSALVDADYLDTEAYFDSLKGKSPPRGGHPPLGKLQKQLDSHLERLTSKAKSSAMNDLRRRVLSHARSNAKLDPGLFSLTVPTGGGKTLASLAFALQHAVQHGLRRVIYVIPFTSIIEQTAQVFRDALGDDSAGFVLEHHSAFEEETHACREARDKLRLAMENWDVPVVVTTAVQFFESLFARRPSRCRKLRNIINSVVILDEAQTLPLALLRPCVAALDELARNYHSSIILCTATQPALSAPAFRDGFEGVREIAPDPPSLYRSLKRVRVHKPETLDDTALAVRLRTTDQVLCIVNTRRHAQALYGAIAKERGARHLTTLMCARHRSAVLENLKRDLKEDKPVRLVATSLIEAGIDVDFPVVYRATAGIDSIAQAAGRCNREGRHACGEVYVFEPEEREGHKPPLEVAQFATAARSVMRRHDDPLTLEAVNAYFEEVYWLKDNELDAKGILKLIRERSDLDFPFEDIDAKFRVIETLQVPVIVPYRGSEDRDRTIDTLVKELRYVERPGALARRLQPYIVQVSPSTRNRLISEGAAEIIRGDAFSMQFVLLSNEDLYNPEIGLSSDDPIFKRAEGLIW